MALLKIQLNHHGHQKEIGPGYIKTPTGYIREWNNEPTHYRKFMTTHGYYVESLNAVKEIYKKLFFWGEWEGNSLFSPYDNIDTKRFPNGLHEPFHSTSIRGGSNTDPYIFGENFKYCFCKQKSALHNLSTNSLILFGSVYPKMKVFYIDTVFVINDFETATDVKLSSGSGYSGQYVEETLEQFDVYLGLPFRSSNYKVYKSLTWWDNKEYFSFVPVKLNHNGKGFERLAIPFDYPHFDPFRNPSGKSFYPNCHLTNEELWAVIAKEAFKQGFSLGIRFDEPLISDSLIEVEVEKSHVSIC